MNDDAEIDDFAKIMGLRPGPASSDRRADRARSANERTQQTEKQRRRRAVRTDRKLPLLSRLQGAGSVRRQEPWL